MKMAEYTKIETAMAIICDLCQDSYLDDFCPEKDNSGKCGRRKYLEEDATDVAPVVYCRHCRSYNKPRLGWCSVHMDREGPDDFCGYGVRMDGDSDALD